MAIDYSEILSTDQKKEILEARIRQFATEAYQLELNLKVLEDETQKTNVSKALLDLEKAIKVHKEELTALSD